MADLSLRLVDRTQVSLPAFFILFPLNCEQVGLLGILFLVFLTILLFAALVGDEICCVTDNLWIRKRRETTLKLKINPTIFHATLIKSSWEIGNAHIIHFQGCWWPSIGVQSWQPRVFWGGELAGVCISSYISHFNTYYISCKMDVGDQAQRMDTGK